METATKDLPGVAFQLRIFEQLFEGGTDHVEGLLTFSLDDLPRTQVGKVEKHPVEYFKKTELALKGGHVVEVAALHQFQSYGDVLEGIPHPYWPIRSALDAAAKQFPQIENSPVVLPPALTQGTCGEGDDFEDWLLVPAVCSMATLRSYDESFGTRLAVVVWFQDHFGLDLNERTKAQIAVLDWANISVEFENF